MADNPFRSFADMRAEQDLEEGKAPIKRIPVAKVPQQKIVEVIDEQSMSFTLNH